MEDSKSPELQSEFYLDCGFAHAGASRGQHVGQPQHASHTGASYQSSTSSSRDAAEGADIFAGQRPGSSTPASATRTGKVLEPRERVEGRRGQAADRAYVSSLAFSSG